MARTIYTERDIEDLLRRGVKELVLTEDVYLTDLARERAEKLGVSLRVSSSSPGMVVQATVPPRTSVEISEDLVGKIKADVLAKLGPDIDAALIERIVRRVVSQLK
jgi:hypothetical protein